MNDTTPAAAATVTSGTSGTVQLAVIPGDGIGRR